MSSKADLTSMEQAKKRELKPKLRFPEFRDAGEWEEKQLHQVAKPVADKAKDASDNILTLSGEHGIVLQSEYFGKKIAGENVSRYIRVVRNDFVYNDRTTKVSIYGSIKRLSKYESGLVSPIYKCFRFDNGENPDFWDWYFESGFHGKQLHSLVNEGARAGRFNISIDKFLSTIVWHPEPLEQQRIADCLSSIDDRITAETQKLDTLKAHKKGLMQQLFPAEGETFPKLRFPEFRDASGWEEKKLNELTTYVDYRGKSPFKCEDGIFLVTAKNIKQGYIDYEISKEHILPDEYEEVMKRGKPEIGDVLLTTEAPLGNVAQVDNENIALAQRIIKFRCNTFSYNDFLKYYMLGDRFQKLLQSKAIGSTVLGIQGRVLHRLPLSIPSKLEQQKIAACLSSIDEAITTQAQKIEALKLHKKGLMQQLFPSIDEVSG